MSVPDKHEVESDPESMAAEGSAVRRILDYFPDATVLNPAQALAQELAARHSGEVVIDGDGGVIMIDTNVTDSETTQATDTASS